MALGSIGLTVAPSDRERVRELAIGRRSGVHVPSSYEYLAERKDGEKIVLQNLVRRVRWWDGDAVQSTVLDRTSRRRPPRSRGTARDCV